LEVQGFDADEPSAEKDMAWIRKDATALGQKGRPKNCRNQIENKAKTSAKTAADASFEKESLRERTASCMDWFMGIPCFNGSIAMTLF
jgi:hypothetical protein